MNTFQGIQPLLPFIIPLIAAMLGYVLGIRTKKVERFYIHVQDNLKDSCSQMFHQIREIKREVSAKEREELLVTFFKTHGGVNTTIYKLSNKYILNRYYEMEDEFYAFLKDRNEEKWKNFWYRFKQFCTMIEDEYWENHDVLYREYRWMRFIWKGNYLLRIFHEFIRILYETSVFLLMASAIALYFIVCDWVININIISQENIKPIYNFITSSILFWISMRIIASHYISLTRAGGKKSLIRKIVEKQLPKALSIWDEWLGQQPKWIRNRISVPEMNQEEKEEQSLS